jgi:hypothetical protein
MTIDERLEALTQSMELFQAMNVDNEKRYEKHFAVITRNFEIVLDSLKSLERTAAAHERRISDLEGG